MFSRFCVSLLVVIWLGATHHWPVNADDPLTNQSTSSNNPRKEAKELFDKAAKAEADMDAGAAIGFYKAILKLYPVQPTVIQKLEQLVLPNINASSKATVRRCRG